MSSLLNLYPAWLKIAKPEEVAFVESVYELCTKHYDAGGDTVVECFTPAEVVKEFSSLEDVRSYCGLKVEQALNCRRGTDSDPELETSRRFDEEWNVK
jgi:hypothetical protein